MNESESPQPPSAPEGEEPNDRRPPYQSQSNVTKFSRYMKENENQNTEIAPEDQEPTTQRSWLKVVKMILEFALAALTALGVTSCISFLNR